MNNKKQKIKKWNFAKLRKLAKEIKQYTEEEAKNRYKYENSIEKEIWRINNQQIRSF